MTVSGASQRSNPRDPPSREFMRLLQRRLVPFAQHRKAACWPNTPIPAWRHHGCVPRPPTFHREVGGAAGGRQAPLTFGGAEVLAGGGEASGPVHVHGGHPELVPPAGPDVRQLHPLVRGLRGRGTQKPVTLLCPLRMLWKHTLDSSADSTQSRPPPALLGEDGQPCWVPGRAVRTREFPGEVPVAPGYSRVFIPKDSDGSVEVKIA